MLMLLWILYDKYFAESRINDLLGKNKKDPYIYIALFFIYFLGRFLSIIFIDYKSHGDILICCECLFWVFKPKKQKTNRKEEKGH